MNSWRLTKKRYAARAFSGDGAKTCGGRWHSVGTAVVYVAQSVSLAALETLVHVTSSDVLLDYVYFRVQFDDAEVESLDAATLPPDWRRFPAPYSLQTIGDDWSASRRSAVLRVPSVIVPHEHNFLINPNHPQFANLSIEPAIDFTFDSRLSR